MTKKIKIILLRLDKIGDLVCTLPTDEIFSSEQFEVHWIVQKGMGSLVRAGIHERQYTELDKNNPKTSQIELQNLLSKLKPDVAISFQGPWWAHYQLWKAGVPLRFGVKSQWHSFFFLNKAVRQKRSLAEKHEFQYNLDLVKKCWIELQNSALKVETKNTIKLGDFNETILSKKYFQIQKPKDDLFFQLIVQRICSDTDLNISIDSKKTNDGDGLNHHSYLQTKKYIVVHAGMAGSALNWPPYKYIDQVEWFLQNKSNDFKVVLTGTDADEPYLSEIKNHFKNHPRVYNLQSKLNFQELLHILYFACYVIAPSTGVAHLAASLDQKVYTLFSPIQVHHPRRWAPRGPQITIASPKDVKNITESIKCPAIHKCLKEACDQFDKINELSCMRNIEINKNL